MADPVFQPLLAALARASKPSLWLADESNSRVLASLAGQSQPLVFMTNRWDMACEAEQHGLETHFSDFDFGNTLARNPAPLPAEMFYRISKERPLAHYIINQAFRYLPEGGSLWLAGKKDEGIKTYFSHTKRLFADTAALKKDGTIYSAQVIKRAAVDEHTQWLNDQDYPQLRWIDPPNELGFYSKPGTYGWNKIDAGSQFLLHQLPELMGDDGDAPALDFLDLGCGYGYLTFHCRELGFRSYTATDNNAAAVRCTQANTDHYQIAARVVADDCGSNLQQRYGFLLCNPPFHQGFDVESSLTEKFLTAARRLLAPGGTAGFVVNSFIPLEAKAQQLLPSAAFHSSIIANNGRFKVLRIVRKA